MSYLERIQAKASRGNDAALPKGSKGTSNPFAGDRTEHIPVTSSDVADGVRRLATMSIPRRMKPEVWAAVVRDAVRITDEGWTGKALALGWHPLDLYGAVTDRGGPADADGMAVWLRGRPVLAICETYASIADGTGRAYFNRCNRLATALLWEIGR